MHTLPVITIIDWKSAPLGEPASLVETEVAGTRATIRYQLADHANDLDDDTRASQALILWHNLPLDAAALGTLPNCRAIVRNGVGYDSIDLKEAAARQIAVCNVPDYGTEEVADHSIALALTLCRQIFPLDQSAKKLAWKIPTPEKMRRFSVASFRHYRTRPYRHGHGSPRTRPRLSSQRLRSVRSQGNGKGAGNFAHLGLGCALARIGYYFPPLPADQEHASHDQGARTRPDEAERVRCQYRAWRLIEKSAILQALRDGRLAGAALDVIEDEPLRTREEAETPNLIATCHAAFCSVESKIELRTSSARIALAAVTGGKVENSVNGITHSSTLTHKSMFRLDQKTSLVTGGASGIGAAITEVFAKAGALVYVADRDEKGARAQAEKIQRAGGKARALALDVTSEDQCAAAATLIGSEAGALDILVNNAGIGAVGTLLEATGRIWIAFMR